MTKQQQDQAIDEAAARVLACVLGAARSTDQRKTDVYLRAMDRHVVTLVQVAS